MDIELKRRLESKNFMLVYHYLKEAYCNGAESMGNVISLSRRTSFILSLKKLLDGLCGPDDPTAMLASSLLVQYSGHYEVFSKQVNEKENHNVFMLSQSKQQSNTLPKLILSVMGTYPQTSFHLFPVLLEETRNITLPLNTAIFPIASFKLFVDAIVDQTNKVLPPTLSPLYSKYLIHYGSPKNNQYDVHPFDYFILRYLHSMNYLNVPRVYNHEFIHVLQKPCSQTSNILALNLFLHYLNSIINPERPVKPSLSSSVTPSISQPDLFFIHAINELWLNADSRIMNDWYVLFRQCGNQGCGIVQQPTKAMIACLTECVKHLALAPTLLTEGTSVFDQELSYPLFYFFAKQFTNYKVQNLKKYHASFSELVHCWAMYLQPWLFTGKPVTDYTAFIQRHYFFYRGLLVLVIKRLAIFPVNSTEIQKTIIETLLVLQKTFTADVFSILSQCDHQLQALQKSVTSLDHSSLYKRDHLTEGFHGLKVSKMTVVTVSQMVEQEVMHCLLTKVCQCFINLQVTPEYMKEELIIPFLARLFEYEETQFKQYYQGIKKDFQPVVLEAAWYEEYLHPLKQFLFTTVATQRQRYLPRLTDPITHYEIPLLVHLMIWLTVWLNRCVYELLHARGTKEGMNWEAYFDDPLNCYVNLRWFADKRNLFWTFLFIGFCKFIYWIGSSLLSVCSMKQDIILKLLLSSAMTLVLFPGVLGILLLSLVVVYQART